MTRFILTIDQGTTSSRAILFDPAGAVVGIAQKEFRQYFPADGWVEHDPEEIWSSTVEVVREVVRNTGTDPRDILACGITNQRETTVLWERASGRPLHRAIVWQDRRTADRCAELQARGLEALFAERTGLLLDPYFSGTKLSWLLDHVDGARARAERGELAFGTIDSFLLWRLTEGRAHKTDATNASRTLLFNIHDQRWDEELCALLDVPLGLLPVVEDCSADFGEISGLFPGVSIPVYGMAGDQQSALIGQCCFAPGAAKSTYGTGCFLIMNTGAEPVRSSSKLLTTVAYRLAGEVRYGIEGSIFIAGAAVQWLRDGLHLVQHAAETEAIARATGDSAGVYLVPAFTGLGAPHWDPGARGALIGMTRDTGIAQIVTATLQAVGYQTRDLLEAMASDGSRPTLLRVDGGMVNNDWVAQFLADILDIPVDRPRITETTALGACFLAGLRAGVYDSLTTIESIWQADRRFVPALAPDARERLYAGWQRAVRRVKSDFP